MSVSRRIADFWDSVKPRTRRGGILATVAILGGALALSIALFVGVAMAWNPYLDYSLNADVNARQWAVLPLSYTASSTCAECHADQQARLASATHEGIDADTAPNPCRPTWVARSVITSASHCSLAKELP